MKRIDEISNEPLREILDRVKAQVRAYAGEQTRVILYGSYARGEARPDSDVDLMIVVPDDKADFQTEDRISDIVFDIGYEHDLLIMPYIVSESQMKKFSGFKVFYSVEREGLLV